MTLRKITIGRSSHCDICLDARYVYASLHHGEIFSDGNRMIYRDTSSNGTLINRFFVKKGCVSLCCGDVILIAGRYLLDWNHIDVFLPKNIFNTRFSSSSISNIKANKKYIDNAVVGRWNWGAMGLYPIWGIYNGCFWAVYVALFAWFLFPLPNLFFGYFGNRLAKTNRYWCSEQDFQYEQYRWKKCGIISMCLLGLFFMWWVSVYIDYIVNL